MYMPLLKFVARKYCVGRDERDDYLAEAVLGFLRAIRTYDSQLGSLDGYVATVASRRLIDMARRRARHPVESTDTLDRWGSSRGDPAQAGAPDMIALAATLSDCERACFERRLRGETLESIAAGLSLSKATVSNALARAKRKLGKELR